jgi:hypothetical protein
MSCVLMLCAIRLLAQTPELPRAQWSPGGLRVLATCVDIDNEMVAVMARGGTENATQNATHGRARSATGGIGISVHAVGRKFGVVLVVSESGFPEERLKTC